MDELTDRLNSKQIQIREVLQIQTTAWPLLDLTVSDCMTRNPIHVTSDTALSDIIQLHHAKQFRHMLVVDEYKGLVGVISDRDVLHGQANLDNADNRADISQKDDRITAADIMSRDLIMIEEDSRLIDALRQMLSYGINCLPVQNDGRLVGILTSTDLNIVLEYLLDPYSTANAQSRPFEVQTE